MENQNLEAEKSTEVAEPSTEETKKNDVSEVEFTDTDSEKKADKPSEDTNKATKTEADAEHAQRRREKEVQERIKKAIEEDRKSRNEDSELEYAKKYVRVNKFSGEAIKDKEDLETLKTQLEMEEKGLDPINDFAKYTADKRRQERQSKETQSKSDEAYYKRDTELFVEVYGKEEAEKMLHDDKFMAYFDKLSEKNGGKYSILAARTKYDKELANAEASKKAKEVLARNLANESAGTGSVATKGGETEEFYSAEQLKSMSQADIEKNWAKVKKSYEKLQK